MEKRYQVFVSSTYADLKMERSKVIQTLIEMDCIPAGMELFPAADEDQFEFIKSVIDDCDYYLLIIGGRYGSITSEGISYTEKEYDYAIENEIKVIALLHENPDEIPVGKSDIDPNIRIKLQNFREKVANNRLVKFWKSAEELPGLVALSLTKTMKMFPAVGWIRADKGSNEQLLTEINELLKENLEQKTTLNAMAKTSETKIDNLADLDEKISISIRYYETSSKSYRHKPVDTTWAEIFYFIAPSLLKHPNDDSVSYTIGSVLFEKAFGYEKTAQVKDHDFDTIKVQLSSLNLVQIQYSKTTKGGMSLFWSLTDRGNALMLELRTIRTKN